MPLPPVFGHEAVRRRLADAATAGRLPHALLFEGPRGVGKQRLALWLGQRLLCAAPGMEPCGQCQACHFVQTLSHPDLHWFIPLELTKKGGDTAEGLAEELAARREEPLYAPPPGLASHGIAAIRLLIQRLALTPALGARKVFVIGDAERLVSQQGAEAAANALLKALEEPPAAATLILTAAEPEALPATILSRVVRVRVARVPDSVVTAFAQQVMGIKANDGLARQVVAAEGCIGKLLAARDPAAESLAQRVREAAGAPARRYGVALAQVPFQARGGFTEMLDVLARRLRAEVQRGRDTTKLVEAISHVMDARDLAQGNVNPQLLTAVLGEDLAEVG